MFDSSEYLFCGESAETKTHSNEPYFKIEKRQITLLRRTNKLVSNAKGRALKTYVQVTLYRPSSLYLCL